MSKLRKMAETLRATYMESLNDPMVIGAAQDLELADELLGEAYSLLTSDVLVGTGLNKWKTWLEAVEQLGIGEGGA